MDFDSVLRTMDTVGGYFWAEEARQLYNYALALPDYAVAVEVGCLFGRSTSVLATVAKEKNLRMTVVDSWRSEGDRAKLAFWDNMKRLGLDTTFLFLEMDSVEASKTFEDNSIDLFHLDSNHLYDPSKRDLKAWIPKVKEKGILCFHDYGNTVFVDGIKKAVDESGLTKLGVYNSLGVFERP